VSGIARIALSLLRPALTSLVALLLVAGCAGIVPEDGPQIGEVESPRINAAESALAVEDLPSAITLLRMAASETQEPAATGLRLEAALLALMVGDSQAARESLRSRYANTGAANAMLSNLVRVHLGALDGENALRALTSSNSAELPGRIVVFQLDTLASLEKAQGHWRRVVDRRLAVASHEPPDWFHRLNEARLWETLATAPLGDLREARETAATARLGGWLDLAIDIRERATEMDGARTALGSWRVEHPAHPASDLLETRIVAMQRAALAPPRRIGVLLPLTGELGNAGRAIQRGILTAHHAVADTRRRPELFFVDTGEEGMPAPAAYREAVDRGAIQIIGPLTKNALQDLIDSETIEVPVLALNRVDGIDVPPTVHQFGLAPEDDARAAAALALALDHHRMTILSSADDWGTRVADAFRDQFEAGGGQVLEHGRYAANQDDMSTPVRELFHLDLSNDRRDRVRSITGLGVHFEDRRREDMDAVFLGAFEPAARLVAPQIRFQRGLDLPILATSQAYSRNASRQASEDLEGLMIMRMPWLLDRDGPPRIAAARAQLEAAGADGSGSLVALGIDAFQLLGPLTILEREPEVRAQGSTGAIGIGPNNQVRRYLLPTRVTREGVRLMDLPASDRTSPFLP